MARARVAAPVTAQPPHVGKSDAGFLLPPYCQLAGKEETDVRSAKRNTLAV